MTDIILNRDSNTDLIWDDDSESYITPPNPIVNELEANNTVYDIIPKAVLDNNTDHKLKVWTGTKAQYDVITTKDPYTLYNITDDAATISLLEMIYPVGSIYIGTMSTCPLAALFGTWALVAEDRVLQGAGTRGNVGTTVNESLPNIKGDFGGQGLAGGYATGAVNVTVSSSTGWGSNSGNNMVQYTLDASRSSSTYQDNAPVQQDAYLVNIWKRTA